MKTKPKINLDTVCFPKGRKVHCVFSDHKGREYSTMYCNRRLSVHWRVRKPGDKHCKECTKELRKAGMSWKWYEKDQFTPPPVFNIKTREMPPHPNLLPRGGEGTKAKGRLAAPKRKAKVGF